MNISEASVVLGAIFWMTLLVVLLTGAGAGVFLIILGAASLLYVRWAA